MAKTTFTVEQLQAAINEVVLINKMFPNLPIILNLSDQENFWSESTFPLTFKNIGSDSNVTIRIAEHHVGGGLESGDNGMYCVLSVGYGKDIRYFMKTGFLDSWDNGNDDYQWDGAIREVTPQEVTKVEWVSK